MKKRMLSLLLCIVMVLALMPTTVFADSLPVLNATISGGTLSWDALTDADVYVCNIGSGTKSWGGNVYGTSVDLNSKCADNGFTTGDYPVTLFARNSSMQQISEKWSGIFHYNSAQGTLDKPTNLKVEGTTCMWDAVTNATSYTVAFQDSEGRSYGSAPANDSQYTINPYTTSLVDGQSYKFTVRAHGDGYEDSEDAVSDFFTYSKPSNTVLLQNVTISGGILSWDALSGAAVYVCNIGAGSKSWGGNVYGTSVDLNSKCADTGFAAGDYPVTLFARNSSNEQICEKWSGTFHYDPSAPATITKVTITGVQDAVGGATCSVDGLVITTEPADACTVREAYWWDETKNSEATTFVAGNSYHLVVKLKPTDGKGCFEYNNGQYVGTATFNGVDADTMMPDSFYVNDLFLKSTSRVASGQITNVAVKGVKDPVGGNTCSTDGIVVTTDVTDGCTIKEILWWDDTNDCEATTFVAGNSYHLNIRLAPAANGKGYFKFDTSNGQFIGTATVNGAPADRKELQSFTNTDLFIASESFVAIGQVTNIKVTGMKTPVAGETCSVEGLTITTDTANSCTVYDAYWWDDTNSKKAASFVAGNSYYLCVIVAPKDGYILLFNSSDKYTGTATINGTAADRMERSVVKPTGVFLTSVVMKAVDPTDKTVVFDVLGHGTAPADQKLASGSKVTKPADPSADEYSFGGWYKDSSFTEAWDFDTDTVTSDIILYAKWEQFDYKMLDGADAEWTKGSGKDLMFRSEAPFAKFVSVKVDDEIVDPSNYTATEGSTRITFRASYLETLKDGIHKLEIVSRDGKASTRFLILAKPNPNPGPNPNPKPDIPKTGDNSHIVLWTAMLVVSGCALGVILCQEFKKRKQDI